MKYDFDTLLSRKGTGSSKWENMYAACPNVPDGIVPFSVADMEFKNPPQIARRITDYAAGNILGYTRKTDEYLEAVAGWMKRRHGWDVQTDWIVDYPGIVPAIFHLVKHLTKLGEGIILMTPVYYPFYNAISNAEGRRIVESELLYRDGRYTVDFEDFEVKAKDPGNTLFIFCSPHNPVGRVWTREEVDRIGRICLENGVFIISDDIHSDLVMDGCKHTFLASISDDLAKNCITCTAPSKTFNTASLLTSNLIITDLKLRKDILLSKKNNSINYCNIFGYQACIAAYNECEDWLDELLVILNKNRLLLKRFIERNIPEIKVVDLEGTYLQWLDCRGLGLDHIELEELMVKKAYLFLDEGYVFGKCGEGFERINIACPTWVLEQALDRLLAAVSEIRQNRAAG